MLFAAYLVNEADLAPDGRDSTSLCPLVSAGTEKHCSCLKSGGQLVSRPVRPRNTAIGAIVPNAGPFVRQAGAGPGVVCIHANASSSAQWPVSDGVNLVLQDLASSSSDTVLQFFPRFLSGHNASRGEMS